jgi:predicted nuclease of predicted toxin-antitoxin system
MNLSPKFADEFCKLGFIASHWSSIGNPSAKDTEIMEYAKANDYVVITN